MREAELRKQIRDDFRAAGWKVTDTSQGRPARGGLASFPDLICFRWDRTLLMECKALGGKLSDGQREWRDSIRPHLGNHLVYLKVDTLKAAREWLNWGAR